MEFYVSLIQVKNKKLHAKTEESLNVNCTFVANDHYIFEGDTEVLEDDGVIFEVIEEGYVDSLGGLTQKELIQVCEDSFGIYLKAEK